MRMHVRFSSMYRLCRGPRTCPNAKLVVVLPAGPEQVHDLRALGSTTCRQNDVITCCQVETWVVMRVVSVCVRVALATTRGQMISASFRLLVLSALNEIKITLIRSLYFIWSKLTSRLFLDMLPSSWWWQNAGQ
jgi:hypothetical protein